MVQFKKILCPVDLSDNSLSAIELATSFAKQYQAKLVFAYVAPQWLPTETIADAEYIRVVIEQDKKVFRDVRPSEEGVEFEHIFLEGNPGPEIVRAAKDCDLVVMSTHGHTGLIRILMGSVAEYVLRHVDCPVVTFKIHHDKKTANKPLASPANAASESPTPVQPATSPPTSPSTTQYVTQQMSHAHPVRSFEKMDDVIDELKRASSTVAPVVDDQGSCIGILTRSDMNKYCELKQRLDDRDESVIDEIFETDEFGQRRAANCDFAQVQRHMTSPVVTISNHETTATARQLFAQHPHIHHLVVTDDAQRPIGILDT